jgi:hypothetical protein
LPIPAFAAPEHLDIARRVGDPRLPLSAAEVRSLGARLSAREIERAEDDIDFLGIMSDPKRRTDPTIFDVAVGSLGVLGYGRPWLARKLGLPEAALAPRQKRRVLPYRMRLVLTAAIRIGSRWATPESTGQSAQQIEDVQRQALDLGFRVPAAYGNLYESRTTTVVLPDPADWPRARTPEEIAKAKVHMLAYFCECGGTAGFLGRRFGLSTRTVFRSRNDDMGMRLEGETQYVTRIAEGQEDLAAEIKRALDALTVGEDALEVYRRLRAFAIERSERLAAQGGAHEAPVAA